MDVYHIIYDPLPSALSEFMDRDPLDTFFLKEYPSYLLSGLAICGLKVASCEFKPVILFDNALKAGQMEVEKIDHSAVEVENAGIHGI